MYTICKKKKKERNWVVLLYMWSGYPFDVCIRKIHLCAFLIYMAGRQTGWKTTNHGNQPWLQPNDRLQRTPNPKLSSESLSLFFCTEITVESDVMHRFNPPIQTL